LDHFILADDACRLGGPLVLAEKQPPSQRADEELDVASGVPVERHKEAAKRLDLLLLLRGAADRHPLYVLEFLPRRELRRRGAAKEIAVPRVVGVGNQISQAVAIEVGESRLTADTAINAHLGVGPPSLQLTLAFVL